MAVCKPAPKFSPSRISIVSFSLLLFSVSVSDAYYWSSAPPINITSYEGCSAEFAWSYSNSSAEDNSTVDRVSVVKAGPPPVTMVSKTEPGAPDVREERVEFMENAGMRLGRLVTNDTGEYRAKVEFNEAFYNLNGTAHLTVKGFEEAGPAQPPTITCTPECEVDESDGKITYVTSASVKDTNLTLHIEQAVGNATCAAITTVMDVTHLASGDRTTAACGNTCLLKIDVNITKEDIEDNQYARDYNIHVYITDVAKERVVTKANFNVTLEVSGDVAAGHKLLAAKIILIVALFIILLIVLLRLCCIWDKALRRPKPPKPGMTHLKPRPRGRKPGSPNDRNSYVPDDYDDMRWIDESYAEL